MASSAKTDDEHFKEWVGYCQQCSINQLRGIYEDEKARLRGHGDHGEDSIGRVAKLGAQAAREELLRRGVEP